MKFKVLPGFYVHIVHKDKPKQVFGPGEVIELTKEQAEAHKFRIEPVEPKEKKDVR